MTAASLRRLTRREIKTLQTELIGTVIKAPFIIDFDGTGSGVWVCDVEVGGNNYLQNIPIKNISDRFYAQLGQIVTLRRNAQGRYEVIGPGDRRTSQLVVKYYDIGVTTAVSSVDLGFDFERVPYSFYATLDGSAPLGVLWADGVTPYNLVRILDANGNPV